MLPILTQALFVQSCPFDLRVAVPTMPSWRQRIAWSTDPVVGERERSLRGSHNQFSRWLSKWSWGQCSATEVVRSAQAFVADNGSRNIDDKIRRLAKTAANINNAERVVESVLPLDGMVSTIDIPDSSIQMVLPPFDLFHWLRNASPIRFRNHLGAKEDGVQEWWDGFRGSAQGRRM